MPFSSASGFAWSCTASNVVTYGERAGLRVLVERAEIALGEADVPEIAFCRLARRVRDRVVREVVPLEGAVRKALGEHEERTTPPAPEVEERRAFLQPLAHAGDEREDVREEHREDRLRALLGHDLVEARVAFVGHPAAFSEAVDDVVLDGGQAR